MTQATWTPPVIATTKGKTERGVRLTPPALYREISRRYGGGGFDLDAAATRGNALAPYCFTQEQSALDYPWQ